MDVIGINCSHRQQSNSGLFLDYVLKVLENSFAVKKVNALDLKISCLGCESCYANFRHHEDGLAELHEQMLKAKVIIFSSPTYFGMPSTLAKVIMDRTNAIWLERGFKDKLGAVIVNGAAEFGAIEMNAKNFVHFFHDHEMINVPFYVCFNQSIRYLNERFPSPLTKEISEPLDKLAQEIIRLSSRLCASPQQAKPAP